MSGEVGLSYMKERTFDSIVMRKGGRLLSLRIGGSRVLSELFSLLGIIVGCRDGSGEDGK